MEEKIGRLVSEGQSQAEAEMLTETVDRERAVFINNYFHADWPNHALYHAMVNMDTGNETVVRAILSFLGQNRPLHATPETQSRSELSRG